MKLIVNTSKSQKEFARRKVLFLRYGTEEPALNAKPIISITPKPQNPKIRI